VSFFINYILYTLNSLLSIDYQGSKLTKNLAEDDALTVGPESGDAAPAEDE
jgi:hypothetical protein